MAQETHSSLGTGSLELGQQKAVQETCRLLAASSTMDSRTHPWGTMVLLCGRATGSSLWVRVVAPEIIRTGGGDMACAYGSWGYAEKI